MLSRSPPKGAISKIVRSTCALAVSAPRQETMRLSSFESMSSASSAPTRPFSSRTGIRTAAECQLRRLPAASACRCLSHKLALRP